jgi:diacylglycerol kinase (ATP)
MDDVKKKWVFIVNPVAGNGFAKTLVPKLREMIEKHNIEADIVLTERSGHATAMDAGSCNGMIFLNGMGLGFDAQVAAENYTKPGKVKSGSKYKYIWHIIKTLLFFREKRMTVVTGTGRYDTDCFINTISIGRRFAGGFYLTPKAIANDGLLDICMIKKLSLFERFSILLKVPQGKHTDDKRVNYYQTRTINLEFPEVVPFHVDGELNFSDRFDVTVLPEALKIIYNPDGNHFFKR